MAIEPLELRTERLLLRPFRLDDVDDVFAYAADPDWSRFLFAAIQPYTRRSAETFVARAVLRDWSYGPIFAIGLSDHVVGGINLTVDGATASGEIGYSIAKEHWGKGLVAEAARALIDWAFPTYDLAKAYARADERNRRSWRVMEKLGMTREALLRKHRLIAGERSDEVVYGLLREEWEASRGR